MIDKNALESINFFNNAYDAINDYELLIIITEWDEFKKLDYKTIYNLLKQKIIINFRSILNEKEIEKIGFKYYYIGKYLMKFN